MTRINAQDLIAAARREHRTALDELAGKKLLASFGVAVPKSVVAANADAVAKAIAGLQPPFVLKVMSPEILHKSDAGGVKTGLRSAAEVAQAIHVMAAAPQIKAARIDGWLIEEMTPAGQEVVVGAVRDPDFGPLVMVGLGGIFVEILADVAFRICPITRLDAVEMLDELKGAALLDGARGRAAVSREAIIDVLLKIGGEAGLLMRHADDFREADINPLIVSANGAVAVDARFVLT
jgi:succinyl-CoA synthetase beta subunit